MLQAMSIRNFKAFGDVVNVDFGSVNLIYGENSSGKSSIIQSLLLIKQTLGVARLATDQSALDFRGAIVDLGGFGAAVHGHRLDEEMQFSFTVSPTRNRRRYRPTPFSPTRTLKYDISFAFNPETRKTRLAAFRITTPVKSIRFAYQESGPGGEGMYLADVESANALIESFLENEGGVHRRRGERPPPAAKDVTWVRNYLRKTPTTGYIFVPFWSPQLLRDGRSGRPVGGSLDSPRRALLQELIYDWQLSASSLVEDLIEAFEDIHYIGPLRQAPQRVALETSSPSRELGSRGERALRLLSADESLLANLNATLVELEIPYVLEINDLRAGDESQDLGEISILSLRDVRSNLLVTLGDVGVGISQIVPVLIQLMLHRDAVIVVEQPELHLHPRLQSRLADVVLRSVREQGNRVILETHSEHILLRLQRRMRAAAAAAESNPEHSATGQLDLKVLYVEQAGSGASRLLELRVGETGDLLDPWPSGFFDDRLEDLLADDPPAPIFAEVQG